MRRSRDVEMPVPLVGFVAIMGFFAAFLIVSQAMGTKQALVQ